MLSRLLRHWTRLPLSGRVSGRRPPASKFDHRSQMTTSLSEWTRESGYGSWTFNATLSFSTGLNVPGTSPRSFEKGQNGGMSQTLSSEEIAVLTILQEAFPEKLHLHQLAPRMALDADPTKLLGIVDALFVRGLVEGRPLRDSSGLADAANMLISGTGTATLNNLAAKTKERRTPTPLPPVQASILHVLIASPSDVSAERDAVVSAIQEWNSSHYIRTGIMLHPVRWETHSYPAAGDRPQGLLNRQIVESAHFLIGIFGNRLGTPTGEAESGTIEEIEQFRITGRHVALYFSNAPVARNADRTQLEALEKYQAERQRDTLYATYGGRGRVAAACHTTSPKDRGGNRRSDAYWFDFNH
jgi:hypothetical protein